MSLEAIRAVFENSRATGSARTVLLVLAEHYNAQRPERGCWPSLARIAEQAGLSRRQTRRRLRDLEALGELQREVPKGRSLPIYRIPWIEELTSGDISVPRKTPAASEDTGDPRKGTLRNVHDRPASGVIRDRPLRGSSVTPGTGEPEATGSSGTYVPGAERRGAENLGDDFRGKAAPIVRQLWWQGKRSPLAEWDMGDEYSFLDPQAEREGWPIVLAAMRQVPGVYSRNGKSFTGKLVFSKKNRDLWNICLDRARRELYGPSDPSSSFEAGGGSIGGLLEEVIT